MAADWGRDHMANVPTSLDIFTTVQSIDTLSALPHHSQHNKSRVSPARCLRASSAVQAQELGRSLVVLFVLPVECWADKFRKGQRWRAASRGCEFPHVTGFVHHRNTD